MKKIIVVLVIVAAVGGLWSFSSQEQGSGESGSSSATNTQTGRSDTGSLQQGTGDQGVEPDQADEEDDYEDFDDRPAAEIYSSADEALKAVREGARDYDDLILEQFTEPEEDCTWCDEFYASVTKMMLASETTEDERSYYAEVLAISGRVENMQTLIQAIIDGGDTEVADIYAEALELSIGGDEVVQYLSTHINSENELLQESSVAAITNQGSKLAAEILYTHTVETGDADGYYSLGIGLAELIPEDETLPYLDGLVKKRDKYSHLALKSLLNHGLGGTQRVIEILSSSSDAEFDRKMLEDAIDHVSYEEEIETYLKRTVETSKSPVVVEFAKEVLEDFDVAGDEDDDLDES